MKKYICILITLLLMLTGCASNAENKPVEKKPSAQETYPKEVVNMINVLKQFKATTSVDVGEKTYIIVSFGPKQGSGYEAKITKANREKDKITFLAEPGVAKDPSTEIMSFDYLVEVIKNEGEKIEVEVKDGYMPKVIGLKDNNYELIKRGNNIGVLGFTNESSGIHVSGIASIWEACVFYELQDEKGNVLQEGTIMAEAGAPDWGFFDLEILEVPKDVSSIVFLQENAKTGEHEELLRLDLKN